ncbi:hypothetical protein ACFVT5_40495 [Streptomyces sp. NPDC058001]|uniref:hypothetical protein n=1 Tax=Streptomyces sp. NPDC058001 TaxID=3346300 RepID=UPI0036EBCEA1
MGTEPARQNDPRMYEGCTGGRSLKEIRRVYGLSIPAEAENLRYCEQESWSGSAGELQFDTSRNGLKAFLDGAGPDLILEKVEGSLLERDWQKIPRGVQVESGTYVNRIGGCDNAITVDVQELRTDEVRIYLDVVCAS